MWKNNEFLDILHGAAISMGYVSYCEGDHYVKPSGYSLLVLGRDGSRIRWGQFFASDDGDDSLVLWHSDDYTGPLNSVDLLDWIKALENTQRVNAATKSNFEFGVLGRIGPFTLGRIGPFVP